VCEAVRALRYLELPPEHAQSVGVEAWSPTSVEESRLREALAEHLDVEGVVEVVVHGSLARNTTTGFSDVDAILVVDDEMASDPAGLGMLRSRVFAAGRAILTYQPMQHHGFVVVTRRLLGDLTGATGLPTEALQRSRSLFGRSIEAVLGADARPSRRLEALSVAGRSAATWPHHAWALHRAIAMFELAPALYLQATGRPTPKHASFEIARVDFPALWRPFDVLRAVREKWTRERMPVLEALATALRNPWAASKVWRQTPVRPPSTALGLLDGACLTGLQDLLGMMVERAERTAVVLR
jgi:hypothetical protein